MALNDKQQEALIPEFHTLARRAKELKQDLDNLIERQQAYKAEEVLPASVAAYKLVNELKTAKDTMIRGRSAWVQRYITSWYRDMHYDMHPLVEIAEKDITDPEYESIKYQGDDTWEIIMRTATHGREKIVINTDTASWEQVYSADKLGE